MDPATITEMLDLVGSVGAPAVAVILSMKYAINGMKGDVAEIKADVKAIKVTQQAHAEKLAVLQDRNTRIDG